MPPKGKPMKARDIAWPLFLLNQRPTAAVVGKSNGIIPMLMINRKTIMNIRYELTKLSNTNPNPPKRAQTIRILAGPKRSTRTPTNGASTIPIMPLMVNGSEAAALLIPSVLTSGRKKTENPNQ